jgi:ATP-dependent DNA helicase RecQ
MSQQEKKLQQVAAGAFGWHELRPDQLAAMEYAMQGRDVLAVLPTGAGKSAIYQVPALLIPGPTLVVSPLLALQQDQLDGLGTANAPEAVAVNSLQGRGERRQSWQAVRDGAAEYVFLAPEQLAKEEVMEQLQELGVGLFVVDEAHCVSAWGHVFRPDYRRVGQAIDRLGHPPVIALTATAAPPVRGDIVERLRLRDHGEVIAGFDRPNLRLTVQTHSDVRRKRDAVVLHVRTMLAEPGYRLGLVYVASRKDAEFFAGELRAAGVRSGHYHAGMKGAGRERLHEEFMADRLDVVVATSAFGMGIDKPDVRFVVHASAPDSLDSYYQHIGRGAATANRPR